MVSTIEKVMKECGIPKDSFKVYGKDKYYQVNIDKGWCLSINNLRQSVYNYTDKFIEINVSCVHTEDFDYCLMVEIFW